MRRSKFKRNIIIAFLIILGTFSYLLLEDFIKQKLFGSSLTSKNEYNCSDFKTQNEAQKFFISNGGPQKDPYSLDKNKDAVACENLP